jgi:hypothetical protein
VATPRAGGFADAYLVSVPLTTKAKAQFLCTMQYWDQSVSVGIQVKGAEKPTWNACGDTVDYYVPMPGDGSTSGFAAPTDQQSRQAWPETAGQGRARQTARVCVYRDADPCRSRSQALRSRAQLSPDRYQSSSSSPRRSA